ncbi:MAG TPA: PQQ-dependent sugar dehydrogenase, partial [Gemmatimonadales bacterium]|nr:PQQ-dependent sugar dehydrogenase [Gemmatimonadales bacterium]
LSLAGTRARAQTVPTGLSVETLASGLSAPVAFEFLSGGRVLYTEQFTARVRLFREGVGVQTQVVLTVPDVVAGGERGLLGLAVDPRFPAHPYLYVFHDAPSPNHIRIVRYTLGGDLDGTAGTPLTADVGTRFDLLDVIPDAASNHNGGTLRFGPDGMLYASLGDDAVPCAAQDPLGLRGVILRMAVTALPPGPGSAFYAQLAPPDNPFAASPDSSARLVLAYGLRNPFRFQVDPPTGLLVIADVGEQLREELDLLWPPGLPVGVPGAGSPGANFGWPYLEGSVTGAHAGECAPAPPGMVLPVFDYDRTTQPGGASIISGGMYRVKPGGSRNLPASYDGDLFANDYYSGALYRIEQTGGGWAIAAPVPGQPSASHWGQGFGQVSDWRVGPDGALWFCRQSVNFAA